MALLADGLHMSTHALALGIASVAYSEQQLTLRVDPTHWFDRTDFSFLLAGTPVDGAYTWANTDTFHAQLLAGVQLTVGVYQFQLQPPP